MKEYTEAELLQIKDRDETWLKALKGVVGHGVGADLRQGGRKSLKVFVNQVFPETQAALDQRYGQDVPVTIERIGQVRKA
jgi:hypothetical protein